MCVNKSSLLWPGRLSLSLTTILLSPLPERFVFVVSLIHDNFKSRARLISYASALPTLCFSNKRARCRRTIAMTIEGKSNRHRLKTNSESKCDMSHALTCLRASHPGVLSAGLVDTWLFQSRILTTCHDIWVICRYHFKRVSSFTGSKPQLRKNFRYLSAQNSQIKRNATQITF